MDVGGINRRESRVATQRQQADPSRDRDDKVGKGEIMPIIDTSKLRVVERLPGWRGRYFHSANMTFAHYDFARGSSVHDHHHPQEEVYNVIEGELELTIDGVAQIVKPGVVAIVPGGVRHSVKALTDGRAIIVDHPVRHDFD